MNLYRRAWLWASAAILLACSGLIPSAESYQRRTPHKLRATALLELTTDASGTVSTRLIPITILANGSFHDASIYESRPQPMALGTGVVYEAAKSGVTVGYVTVSGASNTLLGWVGQGKWQPVKDATQASSAPKPPAAPRPAPGDDRPILHRGGDNPESSPTPPPQTQSGDDRPVLHRGDTNPNQQPAPASSGDQTGSSQSQSSGQAETPDDPNRPVLRHRKPPSSDDNDSSVPSAPPNAPPPAAAPAHQQQSVTPKPPAVVTPGTKTFVAVSDAQTSDSRSYEFIWKPGEREQMEARMRKLALAQLPGERTQMDEHAMTNVVVRSFDLDMSNDAVLVITAEVPGGYLAPPAKKAGAAGAKSEPGKFVSRYVTVIARMDFDGNLHKLAASVTDSSRLDVAPRLEFIDAVDVDGDGLAELLFREYSFDQKSFLIYGVGHGTVTKVFEGASESLK